jgi:hypothetical protein
MGSIYSQVPHVSSQYYIPKIRTTRWYMRDSPPIDAGGLAKSATVIGLVLLLLVSMVGGNQMVVQNDV